MTIVSRRAALMTSLGAAFCWPARSFADTVTYNYDELGRLRSATYSNGSITYVYDAAGNRTTLTQTGPSPPAVTLSANPSSISVGGSSILTWTTSNATSASINNGVGNVSPVAGGSISVSPTATTTYTITAIGPSGQSTAQAVVSVSAGGFVQAIQITGSGPVNLRSLADAAGYNGAQNATVTFQLAGGVQTTGAAGAPNGGIAIDTGAWPTGSYAINLSLQISGKVLGGGGRGGAGGGSGAAAVSGGTGGDAIYCRVPISVTVNSGGEVRAGGGGGGGGNSSTFSGGIDGGGGGGGGYPNGSGGAGGTGGGFSSGSGGHPVGPGKNGIAGAAGTTSGGGGGGGNNGGWGGAGGAGGNTAVAGAAGGANNGGSPGAAGGAAGFAIRKNGNAVSVTNNGIVSGTVA